MAATLVPEELTSSLLVAALTKRLTLSQFLRLILPDESMINAISTTVAQSLSENRTSAFSNSISEF